MVKSEIEKLLIFKHKAITDKVRAMIHGSDRSRTAGAAIAIALLAMAAPADAARFALRCTGVGMGWFAVPGSGPEARDASDLDHIFVIDEEARTFARALAPRQEFDRMCSPGLDCDLDLSTGLIRYTVSGLSQGQRIDYNYTIDRRSGRARVSRSIERLDGSYPIRDYEIFMCAPTEVPNYQGVRNRF